MASIIRISIVGNASDAVRAMRAVEGEATAMDRVLAATGRRNEARAARAVSSNEALVASTRGLRRAGKDADVYGRAVQRAAGAVQRTASGVQSAYAGTHRLKNEVRGFNREAEKLGRFGGLLKTLNTQMRDFSGPKISLWSRLSGVLGKRLALLTVAGGFLLPVILHLASALVPLGGGFLAMPAMVLGAAAAYGTLKLALFDVKKALGAGLTGNVTLLNTTLAKMSPPARTFVRSVLSLQRPLQAMRNTVSGQFFGPFAKEIKPLAARYLPMVTKGTSEIARSMGTVVQRFSQAARKGVAFSGIRMLLHSSAVGIGGAGANIGKVTDAVGRLLLVGGPAIARIGKNIGIASGKFADFIKRSAGNGKLKAWMEGAFGAARNLGRILSAIFSILNSANKAIKAGNSKTLLQRWADATERLARFLKTGKGIDRLTKAVRALDKMGAFVARTFRGAGTTIGQAAKIVGPALAEAAKHAAALFTALRPTIPAFAEISRILLLAIIPILDRVTRFLSKHETLTKGIGLAVGLMYLNMRLFSGSLGTALKIARLYKAVAEATAVFNAASAVSGVAAAGKASKAAKIAGAAGGAGGLAGLARLVVSGGWITVIIAVVAALAIGIYLLATKTRFFQMAWKDAWSGARVWADQFVSWYNQFMSWIKKKVDLIIKWYKELPMRIADGMQQGFKDQWHKVTSTFEDAANAIPSAFKKILELGSPSRLMARMGGHVGEGLANGIVAKVPLIKRAMRALVQPVRMAGSGLGAPVVQLRGVAADGSVTAPVAAGSAGGAAYSITVNVAPGADPAEVGRQVVKSIEAHERRAGRKRLLPAGATT